MYANIGFELNNPKFGLLSLKYGLIFFSLETGNPIQMLRIEKLVFDLSLSYLQFAHHAKKTID